MLFIMRGHEDSSSFLEKPYPRICGWFSENNGSAEQEIYNNLSFFFSNGIECVNYMTDIPKYERAVKIANKIGIQIYAWIPTLLGVGPNKQWLYDNHPEVYVKTKSGVLSYNHPIYNVEHYKFLCPNNPIVRKFIKEMYANVSKIPGLDGINLDYIRYIEINMQKYDANSDTCYCDYCVSDFFNQTNITIVNETRPDQNTLWNQYRIKAITTLVNEISELVHAHNKRISADVYPGPWESTIKTKQKWDDWELDMVFPMIYNGVFKRPLEWVGRQTGEGSAKIREKGKNTKLYTGLESNAMNDKEFEAAVNMSMENHAYGVSVFKLNDLQPERYEIVRNGVKKFLANNTDII